MKKEKAIREINSIRKIIRPEHAATPTWEILYHSLHADKAYGAVGYRKAKSREWKLQYVKSDAMLVAAESFRELVRVYISGGSARAPEGWEDLLTPIRQSVLEAYSRTDRALWIEPVMRQALKTTYSIFKSRRKLRFAWGSLVLTTALEAVSVPGPIFHTDDMKRFKSSLATTEEFEGFATKYILSGCHRALARTLGEGYVGLSELKTERNVKNVYVREGWSWREFGDDKTYTWRNPILTENLMSGMPFGDDKKN